MDDEKLKEWARKPLWRHDEFAALCCGLDPDKPLDDGPEDTHIKVNKAAKTIALAVFAEKLEYKMPSDASAGDRLYDYDKYYEPVRATIWATKQFPTTFPDFIDLLDTKKENKRSDELGENERGSLHKMILGMAISQYGYDPSQSRNSATGSKSGSIESDLDLLGIKLDCESVQKHLKKANERFSDVLKSKS